MVLCTNITCKETTKARGLYRIADIQNAQEDTIAISLSTPLYKRAAPTRCTAPTQDIYEQRLSNSVQKYYEAYYWDFALISNELPDIRMILLGEERYVDSFDTYAESNISTNEVSCEPTSITVAAGTFDTNYCIYESSDQVYKYETYHTVSSKASSKRPLGGLIYYVSYKNDVETYKIELQAVGEHIYIIAKN